MGGLMFQASLGKNVYETTSQEKKLCMVVFACHPVKAESVK
jgi:hypothetical protein